MSDIGSFTFPDLGIEPLTPEQLAAVDPAQLAAVETALNIPGAERVTQPALRQQQEETVTESEAERIARLDRESAERIARLNRESAALDRDSRRFTPSQDAKNTIKSVLATYGLGDLSDYLYGVYARQEVDINNPDALIFAIREQDAYKKRFAANAARAKKGLAELDPASYLELENSYRRLMQSNGLPSGFYDQTDDFTRLLEGDVSVSELQDRIQNGFRAVQDADPEVKRQMQELYGVNEAGLAAYFLDPERAAPILTRQAEAAKVAARAKEQAGFQLTALSAEDLIARGYTPDEAQQAFTKAGQLAGLYTEMGSEEALTGAQKIGAAFGYDVAAIQALEERKRARLGEFQGGGGFARTTGATSGTVETGVGEAQ
jgi:hypothetical protein